MCAGSAKYTPKVSHAGTVCGYADFPRPSHITSTGVSFDLLKALTESLYVGAGTAGIARGPGSHQQVLPVGPCQEAYSSGGPAPPLLPGVPSQHHFGTLQVLCTISQLCTQAAALLL